MGNNTQAVSLETVKRSSQTYIVITAFLSLIAIIGISYYGVPYFFNFMEKDFGWSRLTLTSGNAWAKLIVGVLSGFTAGYLIDRYGPRLMLMAGALMGGIALIGLGFTNSLWMFYFFYIFNSFGYFFGGPLPCQVLVSRWFDKNRGKAMGIAYLGAGIGGAFSLFISKKLVAWYDWHIALSILGILVIVFAFPMAFFIKGSRPVRVAKARTDDIVPIKSILKNLNFYLLIVGSMCSIAAVGSIYQHLKLYMSDISFTEDRSANVMTIVLLSTLIGRVLMGWLADLIHRKYVMILIYLIVACAIPLLLVHDFPWRMYFFAVIFGIGLGGDYMIIPLMAADLFGVKALGRTMAIILVANSIAESAFPTLVGYLHDLSKSYTLGFSILIGIALTGVVIISFLPDKKSMTDWNDAAVERS